MCSTAALLNSGSLTRLGSARRLGCHAREEFKHNNSLEENEKICLRRLQFRAAAAPAPPSRPAPAVACVRAEGLFLSLLLAVSVRRSIRRDD